MCSSENLILLHACCAPCSSSVCELLEQDYTPVLFFYNPNISPESEYNKRLAELERFSSINKFELIEGGRDIRGWVQRVKEHRLKGERSERCYECVSFRLEEAFRRAVELGIPLVTTTLSVSPHKNAAMINEAGKSLSKKYGPDFLEADFKKKGGYRRSVELSAFYGFYRQTWCGCVYSRIERRRRKTSPPSGN